MNGSLPGSLPNLQTQLLTPSTPDSCWQKCMSYPPSNGQECVGAVFFSNACTVYMNNTLLSRLLITENSSATTMLKECFESKILPFSRAGEKELCERVRERVSERDSVWESRKDCARVCVTKRKFV